MTRGRKSRCGKLALGTMLAVVASMIAFCAPAAFAAPADCEYCVNIPDGDGGGTDPSANASGVNTSSQPSDVAATTPNGGTESNGGEDRSSSTGADGGAGGDSGGTAAGKGGDGPKGGEGASGDGGVNGSAGTPTVGAEPASSSDGGGVSPFLILIAVLAAGGVGLAIWQMRRASRENRVGGKPAATNPGA